MKKLLAEDHGRAQHQCALQPLPCVALPSALEIGRDTWLSIALAHALSIRHIESQRARNETNMCISHTFGTRGGCVGNQVYKTTGLARGGRIAE